VTTLLTFIFCIYLLVRALRQKRPGAWILMGGVILFTTALSITLLTVNGILPLSYNYYFYLEIFIVLSIPVAVSIFLALNFARTSQNLSERLAEVKQLSDRQIEQERREAELRAENERRTRELEEARQLQISMLPKKLPELPNLEIAAYMKPATEVGGDYYDFHVSEDGTLTVAVGDATGHGLKAGLVVTATKSLFNAFAGQENISQILRQTSGALKKMNLRGLFMAMAMAKIKDGEMKLSIAGMPSALIFRAASGKVEAINIRALPLGSISRFAYPEQKFSLSGGDVVLLMSDGFPEMFNESGEMLGFEKAAEVLPEIAANEPDEIIRRLVIIGQQWAGSRPPDDDVTFVVLKTV
jgi:serine phosphatase RsbU (regulator of sigma subunit)